MRSATKTREGNVVTLKLDGCSGPFGKVTLRGSLRATFTRAGDVLHVVSKGSVGRFDVNVTIEGFNGCQDACPTAGLAHATVRGPRGKEKSMDVHFDGSDHAKVKGFGGRSFDLALDCDAAEAAE